MTIGSYKVHDEIQNEDKWLKGIFTLPQLCAIGVAVVVGIAVCTFFFGFGLERIGIGLGLVIVIGTGVCVMIPMPEDKYLFGGGELIGVLVIRMVVKKLFKKKIYISNYKR